MNENHSPSATTLADLFAATKQSREQLHSDSRQRLNTILDRARNGEPPLPDDGEQIQACAMELDIDPAILALDVQLAVRQGEDCRRAKLATAERDALQAEIESLKLTLDEYTALLAKLGGDPAALVRAAQAFFVLYDIRNTGLVTNYLHRRGWRGPMSNGVWLNPLGGPECVFDHARNKQLKNDVEAIRDEVMKQLNGVSAPAVAA